MHDLVISLSLQVVVGISLVPVAPSAAQATLTDIQITENVYGISPHQLAAV